MRVGVLVLDTGFHGPAPKGLDVIPHDFCHPEPHFPGIRPGYTPMPDGSDSVDGGSGTRACVAVLDALKGQSFSYKVFSVKVGDSGSPLMGVSPTAVQPALRWVCTLPGAHLGWKWVAYLNYDVAGSGEVRPLYGALARAGIPLVLPARAVSRLDLGKLIPPTPPGVLVAAGDVPGSDFGASVVSVAVDAPEPAAVALAWLAAVRAANPSVPADQVVSHVKFVSAVPSDSWAGRSQSGGVLSGQVR